MIKKLHLSLLMLLIGVWAMASETSVKNADGVEIWYDFDSNTNIASVTYRGEAYYTYADEYIGNVVIPSKVTYDGEEYSVTSIGRFVFDGCSSLTSITIPESVTEIGDYAFYGCSSLTSIDVALDNNSYTSIDGVLFSKDKTILIKYPEGKKDVTSYIIPEGVTLIGDEAFYSCDALTSVTIPESVTSIGEGAFLDCSSLIRITIPEGVTSIGDYAFFVCSSLTSITIPEGVTSIGYSAFSGCSSLTSITIPEGVTSIEYSAFSNCSSLTSITIPEGVTSIGKDAFLGCFKLYEVYNKSNLTITAGSSENGDVAYYAKKVYTDDSGESKLHTVGDYIFYVDEDNIELLVYLGVETAITLPSDYEGKSYKIGNYAFLDCSSLTSITIPEGVTEIGEDAFGCCSSLTSITIPENVTEIASGAFSYCSSLTSITIPESVTEIGESAFYNCRSLTSITIPESVTEIGDFAFYGCRSLTSITIPEVVTKIGDFAFYVCSSLTSIYVASDNNNYTSIDGVLFSKDKTILIKYPEGKKDVTSYTIPENVTEIERDAFFRCSSLTSITIPENVTKIGEYAFDECSSLTSILSMNVTPPSIYGGSAFYKVDKSIPLYVPAESVEAYKSAEYWEDFTNIQGIDDVTPISDVVADSVSIRLIGNSLIVEGAESYVVYALSGQCLGKVESLERGLYIVVADGVSKRIAVK